MLASELISELTTKMELLGNFVIHEVEGVYHKVLEGIDHFVLREGVGATSIGTAPEPTPAPPPESPAPAVHEDPPLDASAASEQG